MKVYFLPNCDGRREVLVAASTQVEACHLIGSSQSGFRAFGGRRLKEGEYPDMQIAALDNPKVPLYRKIGTDDQWCPK